MLDDESFGILKELAGKWEMNDSEVVRHLLAQEGMEAISGEVEPVVTSGSELQFLMDVFVLALLQTGWDEGDIRAVFHISMSKQT